MRYDPLILHYLARELNGLLAGAGARTLRLDAAARVAALETTAGTLLLALHPTSGAIGLVGAPPAVPTVIPLHRRTVVAGVRAPADERLLVVELAGAPAARVRRLVVELLSNQWNALALDGTGEAGGGGGRILAVLWPREAGGRRLRAGAPYVPPPPSGRAGAEAALDVDAWLELLGPVAPPLRATELIARVAWTSSLSAEPLLGTAARTPGAPELEAAYARYHTLTQRGPASPCVLELPDGPQPYPLPLPGTNARPAPSLLAAIAEATGLGRLEATAPAGGGPGAAATAPSPELLERVRRRLTALETRIHRLQLQGAGALDAATALRGHGDVLMANLHAVHKGMERVSLPDFAGGEVTIELDRALSPPENATRLYEEARRRERAAARVPALIAAAEAERARAEEALGRALAGEIGVRELEALAAPERRAGKGAAEEAALPYRRYRTSGGLEVRVGRSRRANDALTFHHSAPNDIWLHARDAGGAHVVLRWSDRGDPEANPPRRDLAEAAVLAALHSRARTSGTVAVDWTRRKHVRKPRKAAPGLVVPERVKTVFVEPDPELEKRLRV